MSSPNVRHNGHVYNPTGEHDAGPGTRYVSSNPVGIYSRASVPGVTLWRDGPRLFAYS